MIRNGNIVNSFKHAFAGIIYCVKKERNMKTHLSAAMAALLLAWCLKIPSNEVLLLLLFIMGVIVTECINTAIEAVVDLVSPEFHPLAKAAKDVSAGAVLLAALASLIAGGVLFLPKIIKLLGG
ncbi:Undecaprenol kinase [bioreactor metagenome]|uniref:Undecaprenol kinase n=1 Tax=bioreactor metagenome TaxID=1076179 RepID=A0A644TAY7_9ZZZZ|nr:diacylglycerol kinase family protein [Negativicutes bacterium]